MTAVCPHPLGLLPNPSLGHCTLGEKPEAGLGLAKDTARPAIRPDLPFSFSITSLEWGNNAMNEGREIIRQPDILPSRVETNAELGENFHFPYSVQPIRNSGWVSVCVWGVCVCVCVVVVMMASQGP